MEKNMKKKIIYVTMLLMLAAAGGCQNDNNGTILLEETGSWQPQEGQEPSEEEDAAECQIYVQVSGAVANPGVYELEEGSRIFQAIELAGGLTETADAKAFNQAEALRDGQMVYVPSIGEQKPQAAETPEEDGRINLNTATEAELMALPGIGAARAKNILDWREKNGGFTRIEDLKNIEGIKDGVFSKIKDSVRVG